MLSEPLQYELSRLVDSAWAVAAFVAHHRDGHDRVLSEAVEDVLARSGLPTAVHDEEFAAALASQLDQAAAFASGRALRWAEMDDRVLLAQGRGSSQVADWIVDELLPDLVGGAGLTGAVGERSATFLDVGAGTAQLAVRFAQRCPDWRVVALDKMERVLKLARGTVLRSGLADRIEVRYGDVTGLADEARYELAWLPISFIPPEALHDTLIAIYRALRPGGRVIITTVPAPDDLPVVRALSRLFTAVSGGNAISQDELVPRLRKIGYSDVRSLPATPLCGVLTGAARPA